MENALRHANACRELLEDGELADALEYCRTQRIDPPPCSLTTQSVGADRQRTVASNLLLDLGRWRKRRRMLKAREQAMLSVREGFPEP